MDALLLSRMQFAWVIAMHMLLPAFTVGLAAYIAVLEGAHVLTRRPVFLRLSQFWLRLFAVIASAEQPVDHPGLPPDFGRHPTRNHRNESERCSEHAQPLETSRGRKAAAPPQRQSRHRDREHDESDTDHQAEGEER